MDQRIEKLESIVLNLSRAVQSKHDELVSADTCSFLSNLSKGSEPSDDRDGSSVIEVSAEYPDKSSAIETGVGNLVVQGSRTNYLSEDHGANVDGRLQSDLAVSMRTAPKTLPLKPFPFSSGVLDIHALHPTRVQIRSCWQAYLENVDPLIKILHRLSTERIVEKAKYDTSSLNRAEEALMFAIYFAAITSMSTSQLQSTFNKSKDTTLSTFRYNAELALLNAGFLTTEELGTLQALVLFISCVRRQDDTKLAWTLTGLAVRLASSQGLEHDGATFGLPPFDTELRRRLWWQLWYLDQRAAEDNGTEVRPHEVEFDTQLPSNVEDNDLVPDSVVTPIAHQGWTEMSFCLMRFEIGKISRTISAEAPGARTSRLGMLAQHELLIDECRQYIQPKYLQHCGKNEDIQYLAQIVGCMLIAKMRFKLYYPFGIPYRPSFYHVYTCDKLFVAAIEVVELSTLLETEPRFEKWRWLINAYFQFLPMAVILAELCVRSASDLVNRAWNVVERSLESWSDDIIQSENGIILGRLLAKARERKAARPYNQLQRSPPVDTTIQASTLYSTSADNKELEQVEIQIPNIISSYPDPVSPSDNLRSSASVTLPFTSDHASTESWIVEDSLSMYLTTESTITPSWPVEDLGLLAGIDDEIPNVPNMGI